MSLTNDNNGMGYTMNVAPAYSGFPNYGFGNGFGGGFGEDWLILFLFAMMFGGGWGGMGGFGGYGADGMFPWLLASNSNTDNLVQNGFDHAATVSSLTGIQSGITSGFGDIQTALCGGFAGVNATVNNAQNALTQQMYTNQISDLERSFAAQSAATANSNALQAQLAQCCCDNRMATADLKYTVASENCADRAAISDGIRDILAATQAQTQAILSQMCNDKIEQKNDTIAQLRSELLYARGQASQDVQTAVIQAGQRSLANEVEQYVAPRPIPAYYVQNPNCCATSGCACGAY